MDHMEATDRVLGHVECPYCGEDVLMVASVMDHDAPPQAREYGPPVGECCGRLFCCQPDGQVEVYILDAEAAGLEDR